MTDEPNVIMAAPRRNYKLYGLIASLAGLTTLLGLHLSGVIVLPVLREPQTQTNKDIQPGYPDKQKFILPISLSDLGVLFVGMSYSLQGDIYSITQTNKTDEWKMVLRGKGQNIYFDLPFSLSSKTPITDSTNRTLKPDDLKINQPIMMTYFYDIKNKAGTVTMVNVLPGQ